MLQGVGRGTPAALCAESPPVAQVRPHLAAVIGSEASLFSQQFMTLCLFPYFYKRAIFSSPILSHIVFSLRTCDGGAGEMAQ